jgi:hypothetical protein
MAVRGRISMRDQFLTCMSCGISLGAGGRESGCPEWLECKERVGSDHGA